MKRIKNYRTGDRAERLGVVLLQSFCAVAEVPRQEDFGLIDAVATLLRRDGRYLYAEDSFSVQFKSRTERRVEYSEAKWEALLCQDVPLLVAQVDLRTSSVELHTLGVALAHPNVAEATGLVAHLRPSAAQIYGLSDGVLHVPLVKPILKWSTTDTEDESFTDRAYSVLKAWMSIERWNRRYRRAGLGRQILWETNEVPSEGGEVQTWHPARGLEILSEVAPFARLLATHAMKHAPLREPTRAILSWLRGQGVEADASGVSRLLLDQSDCEDRLRSALDGSAHADVAVTLSLVDVRADFVDFWLFARDRDGKAVGERNAGSPEAILAKGIAVTIDVVGDARQVTFDFTGDWLGKRNLVAAAATNVDGMERGNGKVCLFRRVDGANQS